MAGTLACQSAFANSSKPPRILLRSSWQTVNIGDIAHTPGVLSILRQHLPDAEVTLWPSLLDNGVEELLLREFPKLKIAKRGSQELDRAFDECDFLLHGSGASVVAQRDLVHWHEKTGKPYGIYGITLPLKKSSSTSAQSQDAMARSVDVLSQARFVFFRDSKSLALAKKLGAKSPVMEFGPDGAFACDLRNARKAETFLAANGLEEGKFLCCIPRLRYTPYWTIKKHVKFDPVKHARNEEMKEHDHAPLREAIVEVVKHTNHKVLVCPEDRTQMAVGKEMLIDKLPKNVLDRVVWRPDYWLTGEAVSVYIRSAGLFGNEMHSPIMCIGHGVPAIVCRFAEQTSKGLMWEDIGLGDWLFDHDSATDRKMIVPTVLEMAKNPAAAKAKAAKARAFVEKRQRETMDVLKQELNVSAKL
ncbi:polysaccharide pyruvyl transferase family protein [Thalassoroseus pseudoceratinae]|uniref:polysaccharide pyruvyl transferase family protein n=1 Tax=Thalassoroseus pseudoceratinae TaxID=2713176 RepID=UPI0036F1D52B